MLQGCGAVPEDAPYEQAEQMREVEVSPVEELDLPGTDAGADRTGPGVVVIAGRVHDGKTGEQALESQPRWCRRATHTSHII